MAVGVETEYHVFLHAAVAEHCHLTGLVVGVEHYIHAEVLARQAAMPQGVAHREHTVKGDRCRCRDAGGEGCAQQLKVVDFAQVVARDGFREGQFQVVADAQDAVDRFWRAEEFRQARVLDAFQDGRCLRQVSAGIAAVVHGPDVVVLLHGIHFTVEGCDDDAVGRDGVCHSAGLLHEFLVLIVGAGAHPVLVALRREFVLQLDVVEPGEVHVEAVNAHRHVVRLPRAVVGAFGVHHPVVARHTHVHLAG